MANFLNSINILEYLEHTNIYDISFKIVEKLIENNNISINSKIKTILNNFYDNLKI